MHDHALRHGVSVIGLGAMGAAIARTFIAAGYRVSVWNRSPEKVEAVTRLGAAACGGPKEAIQANAYTVVCLTDYPVWNELIACHDLHEAMAGKCIIQLTGGTHFLVAGRAVDGFYETLGDIPVPGNVAHLFAPLVQSGLRYAPVTCSCRD